MILFLIVLLLAYLLGSLTPSYWIVKIVRGLDIRDYGSGNPGMTNVYRLMGLAPAVLVFLLDLVKGFAAVYWLSRIAQPAVGELWAGLGCALAVVAGHMWTPFLKFRGGRGVNTAAGAFLALTPYALSGALVVWVVVFAVGRIVSLASIAAAFTLPVLVLLAGEGIGQAAPTPIVVLAILVAAAIIFRHRANIKRLLKRREGRLGRVQILPNSPTDEAGNTALVLGGGSWGTTLALLLHDNGIRVRIWDVDKENVQSLRDKRESRYLPGPRLPESIELFHDLASAFGGSGTPATVVFAVPAQAMEAVSRDLVPYLDKTGSLLVNVAKGIDNRSLECMSDIITDVLDPRLSVVSLSGPSHAEEVSRGVPTTVVAASRDSTVARLAQDRFMNQRFRVYTNTDIVGVELGGALKNVIAIAAGISDGLGFGDNTKGALLTRGLAEIIRLGVRLRADPRTFAGLSGMGDLITTCFSGFSRNRLVGERLGKGENLQQILDTMVMVAEGVETTRAAGRLAEREKVDMPITGTVAAVLFQDADPREEVARLMEREAKPEIYY
jgi:glycerol-3-phosphate dehydrogenase (NAD(P)+)